MNIRKTLLSTSAVTLAFALSGCDVDQTEQAQLPDVDVAYQDGQIPKYEVDVRKTQDGKMPKVDVDVKGGNLPKFDVDTADISVGTKEVDVDVPDVDVSMEKKTFSVPDVDIEMPDEGENDE